MTASTGTRARPAAPVAAILAVFVLSGAAGLMYEIVWSRQLVLVFGNTTQAVSAILTGFFGGMAIGAAVGGRIADRVRSPLRLYGILECILVVVVLVTPISFGLIREVYRGIYPSLEGSPGAPGDGPPRPGRAGPGAGDRPHGRDLPEPDPLSRPDQRAEPGVRAALCGQHASGPSSGRWPRAWS